MGVETENVAFVGRRQRLLRLNYFQVVGDARGKAVPRLLQCLARKINQAACHLDLIGGCRKVETGGADFVVDLAAQVVQLLAALAQ